MKIASLDLVLMKTGSVRSSWRISKNKMGIKNEWSHTKFDNTMMSEKMLKLWAGFRLASCGSHDKRVRLEPYSLRFVALLCLGGDSPLLGVGQSEEGKVINFGGQ